MRQITITCAGNSAVADSCFAGYQGEHNATQLSWELSYDLQNYNYILAFALPDGNTESIIIDNTAKPYVSELTQAIEQFIAATDQLGKISILA